MTAHEEEAALLDSCALAACWLQQAHSQRQAHVYRLAAMVVQSRYPAQADALMQVSDSYLAAHPGQLLPSKRCLAGAG